MPDTQGRHGRQHQARRNQEAYYQAGDGQPLKSSADTGCPTAEADMAAIMMPRGTRRKCHTVRLSVFSSAAASCAPVAQQRRKVVLDAHADLLLAALPVPLRLHHPQRACTHAGPLSQLVFRQCLIKLVEVPALHRRRKAVLDAHADLLLATLPVPLVLHHPTVPARMRAHVGA